MSHSGRAPRCPGWQLHHDSLPHLRRFWRRIYLCTLSGIWGRSGRSEHVGRRGRLDCFHRDVWRPTGDSADAQGLSFDPKGTINSYGICSEADGVLCSQVWFRLPDGGIAGVGYPSTNYQTLRELFFGSLGSITTQPGTASFSLATLSQAVAQILAARQPIRVRTLDYRVPFPHSYLGTQLRNSSQ